MDSSCQNVKEGLAATSAHVLLLHGHQGQREQLWRQGMDAQQEGNLDVSLPCLAGLVAKRSAKRRPVSCPGVVPLPHPLVDRERLDQLGRHLLRSLNRAWSAQHHWNNCGSGGAPPRGAHLAAQHGRAVQLQRPAMVAARWVNEMRHPAALNRSERQRSGDGNVLRGKARYASAASLRVDNNRSDGERRKVEEAVTIRSRGYLPPPQLVSPHTPRHGRNRFCVVQHFEGMDS